MVERITMLVTAKTYPTISSRYNETVCTAGITDNGLFVRIYPICYRSLPQNERFKKYQWISFDAIRDLRDPRKESYKLIGDIFPSEFVTTDKQWANRRNAVLYNVQSSFQETISAAYDPDKWKSLCIFKPCVITKFNVIDCSLNDNFNKKREILLHRLDKENSLAEDIPYFY
jgi:hypothetical protein